MLASARRQGGYDLDSRAFFADPERTFGTMRREDPVYFDRDLEAWILTRYDDVSWALRSEELSVDRNGEIGRGGGPTVAPLLREINRFVSQLMVFSDAPRHTRLRSLVARAFQPRALQALTPRIESTVDELLDAAAPSGTLKALADLGVPLSERITAYMLGLPEDAVEVVKRWTEDLFSFVGAAKASDESILLNAAGIDAFHDFVSEIVRERRRAPADDLTSKIVDAAGSEFSEREVVGVVIALIAGAYETTAYAIANGLFALLQHPEQLTRLAQRPALIAPAVEELFRFDGPALAVQRRTKQEVHLRGQKLAARDRIYCMLHAANHDPDVFDGPDRLDIARDDGRQLGLGLGPHFCLGAWLTRIEVQCAILKAIQRYPTLRIAPGASPEWVGNFAIRGLKELELSTFSSGFLQKRGERS
jgi:cytochrome P450